MKRRTFLQAAALACTASLPARAQPKTSDRIMTVLGELPAAELGAMLPHEHVLVDFIGAAQVSPDRYDADEVFETVLPFLVEARKAGCQSMAECTPAFLGRDPRLLQRLSKASGIKLLTNTGYYGAGQGKYLPRHAYQETASQLASRWIKEWEEGIADTGVRPGFIKIGVDGGKLTEINAKLVQAAAECHLESGLTIAGHTGDGQAALEQVEILKKAGVSPAAWIWVHAQSENDSAIHERVASEGAWVELDGVGPTSITRHVELVKHLQRRHLLDRVLISHDAGWYAVGEPRGGTVRGYHTLFAEFLPALKGAGMSDHDVELLTVTNPAKAFAIQKRRL